MSSFEKHGTISDFTDSCTGDQKMPSVKALKLGGGQSWLEAYEAVGLDYDVVGGHEPSLGAAGGWLMGGGLSPWSRRYGLGVDNVLQFEVVLANGNLVTADRCSYPDLFWALRGGGGGSFGVVTAVQYKLRDVVPITTVHMWIDWAKLCPDWPCSLWPVAEEIVYSFMRWFYTVATPYVDHRWSGIFDIQSSSHFIFQVPPKRPKTLS